METACSTCLGSFTSISDLSTIPCGHVFHTDCIKKWLEKGSKSCSQCRKEFQRSQIIKLYFSESQSENTLITELEEAKLEAIEESLKFQQQNAELLRENSELRKENSVLLGKTSELQGKMSKLQGKTSELQGQNSVLQGQNTELQEENIKLLKHLRYEKHSSFEKMKTVNKFHQRL